jgi:tetratricopeptide (TPR) repeat protein
MSSELLKMKNFLWEAYNIDYRKNTRTKIKNASEKEKIEINNHLTLNNFFLLRLRSDPGFLSFVSGKIFEEFNESPRICNLTRMVLMKLFFENTEGIDNELYKIKTTGFKSEIHPKEKYSKEIEESFQEMSEEAKHGIPVKTTEKISYLMERLERAKEINNEDEMIAIDSILFELINKNKNIMHNLSGVSQFYKPIEASQHHRLFESSNIYLGISYTQNWEFLEKQYRFENIKYLDIYNKPESNIDLQPISGFFHDIRLTYWIVEIILGDYLLDVKSKINQKNSTDFIHDIEKIIQLMWFNDKNEDEKKKLLNGYYPYKVNYDHIEKSIEYQGYDLALSFAAFLFRIGFWNEAKSLYSYLLKTGIKSEGLCYKYLGDIAKDQFEYDNALKLYLKSLKQFKDENKPLETTLLNLDISEIGHYLNDINYENKYLENFKILFENLPNNLQIECYYWAAKYFKKIHNFEREYESLKQLHQFNENILNSEKISYAKRLLSELESCKNLDGTFDTDKLKIIEEQERYDFYFEMGERVHSCFQFDIACIWFESAIKIKNESLSTISLGIIAYTKGLNDSKELKHSRMIFENLLSSNPEEMLAHEYLGILDILDNDMDSGVSRFQKTIELALRNGISYAIFDYLLPLDIDTNKLKMSPEMVSYTMAIRLLIKELLSIGRKSQLFSILDRLEETVSQYSEKGVYYNELGSAFTDFGFFNEGLQYYQKALDLAKSDKLKVNIYCNIGTNYANQNKHKAAIASYEKTISLNGEYTEAWRNKSSSEGYMANYKEGLISINKAIEYANKEKIQSPEKIETYKKQKEYFELMATDVITLENITDEDIKSNLISAETILFKTYQDFNDYFDFSIALVEYGKAVECMLHNEISTKIRKEILKKYNGRIPKQYWNSDSPNCSLPDTLKSILGEEERTISLGQWQRVPYDLKNRINNPVVKDVSDYINHNIPYKIYEMETLFKISDDLSDIRNSSAHKGKKTREDVLKLRNEIIQPINEIISIIYKKHV